MCDTQARWFERVFRYWSLLGVLLLPRSAAVFVRTVPITLTYVFFRSANKVVQAVSFARGAPSSVFFVSVTGDQNGLGVVLPLGVVYPRCLPRT